MADLEPVAEAQTPGHTPEHGVGSADLDPIRLPGESPHPHLGQPGDARLDVGEPILDLRDVRKTYMTGSIEFEALRGIDLHVPMGDYLAIMGPSGSGKSTLMHILGCLDVPTSGTYRLAGDDVSTMDEQELAHIRNKRIGFVFQQFNLLTTLSAWRNVELPLIYAGVGRAERKDRAIDALEKVGLGDRIDNRPGELSGGQQQRVSVARALVTNPDLILADEPTGNLDSKSTYDVLALFRELHEAGRTIVLITHEHDVGQQAGRMAWIRDGLIFGSAEEAEVAAEQARQAMQRESLDREGTEREGAERTSSEVSA